VKINLDFSLKFNKFITKSQMSPSNPLAITSGGSETRIGDKTNLAGAQSRPAEKIILRYSENESGFFIKIQQVYNQITNVTIPLSYDY
jgi:hypothetical protein